jgi:DNA-binding NtrC family response regulator
MSDPPAPMPDDELFQGLVQRLDARMCPSSRYLEQLVTGSLTVAEAATVAAHLEECLVCLNAYSRLQALGESAEPRPRLIVDSPSTRRLRQEIDRLARMDDGAGAAPPVLIAGEIGTGKGVVAWEIHTLSRRPTRAFIEVDCRAGSASRLELELFGCERGTSADVDGAASGLFEAADGGTVFLDDVDCALAPPAGQAPGGHRRRGGATPRQRRGPTARCSRHRRDARRSGRHRPTRRLPRGSARPFTRATLTLLPLRERPDDIVPLARHFAAKLAQRRGEASRLTSDAEERLQRYRWPGNVRELSAVIERALTRHGREPIGADQLGLPRA